LLGLLQEILCGLHSLGGIGLGLADHSADQPPDGHHEDKEDIDKGGEQKRQYLADEAAERIEPAHELGHGIRGEELAQEPAKEHDGEQGQNDSRQPIAVEAGGALAKGALDREDIERGEEGQGEEAREQEGHDGPAQGDGLRGATPAR